MIVACLSGLDFWFEKSVEVLKKQELIEKRLRQLGGFLPSKNFQMIRFSLPKCFTALIGASCIMKIGFGLPVPNGANLFTSS